MSLASLVMVIAFSVGTTASSLDPGIDPIQIRDRNTIFQKSEPMSFLNGLTTIIICYLIWRFALLWPFPKINPYVFLIDIWPAQDVLAMKTDNCQSSGQLQRLTFRETRLGVRRFGSPNFAPAQNHYLFCAAKIHGSFAMASRLQGTQKVPGPHPNFNMQSTWGSESCFIR
jgi:hypothetical protein